MSSTMQEIPDEVLEVFKLPGLDGLTDDQTRGRTCVWDRDEVLTIETAVDLGERMSPLRGSTSLMRWFPRSCREHAATAAYKALFDHTTACSRCKAHPSGCPVGDVLRRLARGARL
ncbi:hypothetical protein [Streptomyces gibsoniae]|uniref:Uncharacterized protein n=1 Tax=Streptomyces gibsoniae TaxID=3075529 RepID=A0ABU2U7G1_9ACTN|nr:hypothetical protein [Streptomyces sp. DSM 41699]MDT0469110.1 hypothetical protein [Streptomyces sp. DSM 41699]